MNRKQELKRNRHRQEEQRVRFRESPVVDAPNTFRQREVAKKETYFKFEPHIKVSSNQNLGLSIGIRKFGNQAIINTSLVKRYKRKLKKQSQENRLNINSYLENLELLEAKKLFDEHGKNSTSKASPTKTYGFRVEGEKIVAITNLT